LRSYGPKGRLKGGRRAEGGGNLSGLLAILE
jgi:hypothetical protein